MKIIFDDKAEPIRDCDMKDLIINYYKKDMDIYTSNELLLLTARGLIAEKKLYHKRIEFWIGSPEKDSSIPLGCATEHGQIVDYHQEINKGSEILETIFNAMMEI